MAHISPFKGILYNKEKIKNIRDVVAPPYDVISPIEQEILYERHINNVVRLILCKESNGDTSDKNRYTMAKNFFEAWQRDGILAKDTIPSIYLYAQEYSINNALSENKRFEKKKRLGFIALSKLEDFEKGGIYPHENTLSKPKEDRLMLMRSCNANFSPIFGLFSDHLKKIDSILEDYTNQSPLYDFIDYSEVRHTLWAIRDENTIKSIIMEMTDKQILIADGHHRYETAITYRSEIRKRLSSYTGDEPFNYIMMYFTNTISDGLSILPIHRLIRNLKNFNKDEIQKKIEEFFNIETISFNGERDEEDARSKFFSEMKTKGERGNLFGMYSGKNSYFLLKLKDKGIADKMITNSRPESWKMLDVTILHTILIEKVLGISEKNLLEQKNITYTINTEDAIKEVREGKYQMALFLNPTKIEEIQTIATSGEKMPQKSTFFYPKLITGLVMNKLD